MPWLSLSPSHVTDRQRLSDDLLKRLCEEVLAAVGRRVGVVAPIIFPL